MMHKFFLIGFFLMGIITFVSIYVYIDNFENIQGINHLSTLAGIGLNIMWMAFFAWLYKQNKPNKNDLSEINQMIEEFNVKNELKSEVGK